MAALLLACCIVCAAPSDHAANRPAAPVMLANVYDGQERLSDYWVSEKYDGVRAYWDGHRLLTRAGNPVHVPGWFVAGWPEVPLDGELWIGRGQFEAVASTVRDEHPDDAAWRQVRYMVFDLPAHAGPFTERLRALTNLLAHLDVPWVRLVPQFKVADRAALNRKLQEVVAAGGEGLMLHRGASLYRAGRSDDLLKLKPYRDAEALVVGYVPGKGKYAGMLGALIVQRPDGVCFRLGTGFSDEDRRNPPRIGSWVTYAYQGLTRRGMPRFARFMRVRREDTPLN